MPFISLDFKKRNLLSPSFFLMVNNYNLKIFCKYFKANYYRVCIEVVEFSVLLFEGSEFIICK